MEIEEIIKLKREAWLKAKGLKKSKSTKSKRTKKTVKIHKEVK